MACTSFQSGRVADLWSAFTSAAKADAPKPSALQKSKAAMGMRASDPAGKKEKANENSLRVAEVSTILSL